MKRIMINLDQSIKCQMTAIVTLNILAVKKEATKKDILLQALADTVKEINDIWEDTVYNVEEVLEEETILETIVYLVDIFKLPRNAKLIDDIQGRKIIRVSIPDIQDPANIMITCE